MGRWRKVLGGRTIRLINAMESNTMAEAAAPMIWERNNEYKKFKEKIKKKIKYCSGSYSMRKPSRIHTGRASRAAKKIDHGHHNEQMSVQKFPGKATKRALKTMSHINDPESLLCWRGCHLAALHHQCSKCKRSQCGRAQCNQIHLNSIVFCSPIQ